MSILDWGYKIISDNQYEYDILRAGYIKNEDNYIKKFGLYLMVIELKIEKDYVSCSLSFVFKGANKKIAVWHKVMLETDNLYNDILVSENMYFKKLTIYDDFITK